MTPNRNIVYAIHALCIYDYEQTFVDIPHNSSVVNRSRNQEVSIPSPADVVHILYVSPKNKLNDVKKKHFILVNLIIQCVILTILLSTYGE